MKRDSEATKKKQKQLLSLGVVVIFLIVFLFTYFTSAPKVASQPIPETHVDLPGKDLNSDNVRLSSIEAKNELFDTRVKFLEDLLVQQQEEEEKNVIEKESLQHEIHRLKEELQSQLPSSAVESPVLHSETLVSSTHHHIPYKLQFYERDEAETELGNVETTIPAGATAKALLLSSVDAPCGVQATSDPHPVKLRILADSNLPKGVHAKLKGAIFIGSAYGNLSSERVYVRIERMTQVKRNGDFMETDVTGFVTGEDGKYGLRGVVVDRSNKLIASAAFAGFLDGINQYLQATTNAQTLAKATQGLPSSDVINLEVLKSSSLNGVSSGLDRLSDYYIRRAEQLQPVIQVAAGRIVDITFTHSTQIGDLHTKDKLREIRERSRSND